MEFQNFKVIEARWTRGATCEKTEIKILEPRKYEDYIQLFTPNLGHPRPEFALRDAIHVFNYGDARNNMRRRFQINGYSQLNHHSTS